MIPEQLIHFRYVRVCTLAIVENLTQDQLDFSPPSGEWTIGEILDHLRLDENTIRNDISELIDLAKAGRTAYIYRTFAEFDARPTFIPKAALPLLEPVLFFLNRFPPNRTNIRDILPTFTLPFFEPPLAVMDQLMPNGNNLRASLAPLNVISIRNPSTTEPTKGKSGAELRTALSESLRMTAALFENNSSLDYSAMTCERPMLGIQTVPQMLATLGIEEKLHQEQMVRVIAEPSFPQNVCNYSSG